MFSLSVAKLWHKCFMNPILSVKIILYFRGNNSTKSWKKITLRACTRQRNRGAGFPKSHKEGQYQCFCGWKCYKYWCGQNSVSWQTKKSNVPSRRIQPVFPFLCESYSFEYTFLQVVFSHKRIKKACSRFFRALIIHWGIPQYPNTLISTKRLTPYDVNLPRLILVYF